MAYQTDTFKDFARRTLANLEHIRSAHAKGEKVFETTQLVNCMLGLITFPYEQDRIPTTRLDQLTSPPWPQASLLSGNGKVNGKGDGRPKVTLKEVVRGLRHAVSHKLIEFRTDRKAGRVEIVGLRFWNNRDTWELVISVDSLHAFVVSLAAEIIANSDVKSVKRNGQERIVR